MAIALIYMNFFVPIQTIKEIYPGGWERCLKNHEKLIGGRVWFDYHLFHDGAIDSRMIEGFIATWEKLGFQIVKEING